MRRIADFLAELKRRHVYRMTVVYAAVAFVVWQVADILVPALDLPTWLLKLAIIGPLVTYPFAAVLAWAYELTPDGIRRTPERDAEAPRTAEVHTPESFPPYLTRGAIRRLVVGGAAAVIFVMAGWWAVARPPAPAPDLSEVTLAVFPFAVRGGEAVDYLKHGVVDLLSRNLSGALELQPLDPSFMLKVTGGVEPEDVVAARGIARRVGAGRFVVGSVNEAGGRLRIHAELFALSDTTGSVSRSTVEGDTTQLFLLVDRLTAELLAGLRMGAVSERLVRTAATTTHSLAALKAYLLGEQHYRAGRHDEATESFNRAIEADSAFALARYRLAVSHHMRGEHAVATGESTELLRFRDRLGPHDRRLAEAFHALHTGEIVAAERQLRAIVREYPRDLEARVVLAELLADYSPYRAQPVREAKLLLEEVITADPRFACIYCRLVGVAVVEPDTATVRRVGRLMNVAAAGDSTAETWEFAVLLGFFAGDTAAVRALYAAARDTAPGRRQNWVHSYPASNALQFRWYGFAAELLAAWPDTPNATHGMIRRTLQLERGQWRAVGADIEHASAEMSVAAVASIVARAPLEFAPPAAFAQLLMRLTDSSTRGDANPILTPREAGSQFMRGVVHARLGDTPAALACADSLSALAAHYPQHEKAITGMAHVVRADAALRNGDAAAALRHLERFDPHVPPGALAPHLSGAAQYVQLRAAAHLAAEEYGHAYRWLTLGLDQRQPYMQGLRSVWYRDMARALDGMGRTDEARTYYAWFIDAWQDADAELQPQVQAAAQRLHELSRDR